MCSSRRTSRTTAQWRSVTTFEVFKYLGVADIGYNQPKSLPYPSENPFNK